MAFVLNKTLGPIVSRRLLQRVITTTTARQQQLRFRSRLPYNTVVLFVPQQEAWVVERGNGSALNQLNNNCGLALNENSSTLYIADTNNHRIMSYASGAATGTVAAGGNGAGTLINQLYGPMAVYFDSTTNSLVIANTGVHTIVRWAIGATVWTLVAGYPGFSGSLSTMLNSPACVIFDSLGNMYVADTGNYRIQFFSAGQRNGTTIAGVTGVQGNAANLLNNPRSIALDNQLNLYVADTSNNRIQMFSQL
ncbi:unnamed protein product [Rotaria socialis]|uniref:NHL repeat containing protein n=1 Tax=Rotaria socialis TaxID=392032 RepID=A0A817N1S6_9BILA|nr:unnamed protein product [Rotaria socialis]